MKRSLEDRLEQEAQRLQSQAGKLKTGPERDAILAKIRQCDVAAHIDKWVASPGLQPPK